MILIVAEKPSVARDIASTVGANKKQRGYLEGNGYLVSWCMGHLVEACQPEDYDPVLKKWVLETLPIFPAPFRFRVLEKTKNQFHTLRSLMHRADVDSLICATDAGREGELIFRLVYDQAECQKPWKRLWISSMEPEAIRQGLETMRDGHDYDHLADAARCRQMADWLFGINLTRLYTLLCGLRLPTGRVQSPTLAMIVQRQERIDSFQPTPYYIVSMTLGYRFTVRHRFETQEEAQAFLSTQPETAVIRAVTHRTQRIGPPRLYHSAAMQQEANRLFGYTATNTLANLQGLYEEKLATYPRTDSRYITEDMEEPTRRLIAQMQGCGLLPECEISDLKRTVNGSKVKDHPALLPTLRLTSERFDQLSTAQHNIMTLLLFRLLEATAGECVQDVVTMEAEVSGVLFEAKETITVEPGWKEWRNLCLYAVGIRPKAEPDAALNGLDEGDEFPVTASNQETAMTKPPKPYTEASLLSAMETAGQSVDDPVLREAMRGKGLGTAATRAAVIESLVTNGYVVREGKYLIPTEKARKYISVLLDTLKDPIMTAQWEAKLLEIEEGRGSPELFLREIQEFLSSFITGIQADNQRELYEGLFPESGPNQSNVIGKCPLCGGDVAEYPKSFGCTNYKTNGCRFTIWKTVAGKQLSASMAHSLLSHGKTRSMKGFRNRKGESFEAALELVVSDNSAEIRFSDNRKSGAKE